MNKFLSAILLLLVLTGCHPRSCLFEPKIVYTPQKRQFEWMTSEFKELSDEEIAQEWSRELKIGLAFAREFDFYRAITALKRAIILMPPDDSKERRMEAEFRIIQCYFLSQKYQEAVEAFEFGSIRYATSSFPAFRDLLVILYESYFKTSQCEKSDAILFLMQQGDPETALDLQLFTALDIGNLEGAITYFRQHPYSDDLWKLKNQYDSCYKSVRKAQILNGILPGAGYFYVGQRKTALTSLILNISFIAAAYHFFESGNWGAGLFTTSLECGWYFGGINGAGLAAKEYNEYRYQKLGKEMMIKNCLFPVLMLQTGF